MVTPVNPVPHEHGPPVEHQKGLEKGIAQLSTLLASLQDIEGDLPPAVQQVVTLAGQITPLLDVDQLRGKHAIIPALHKAIASLHPIVHQVKDELENSDAIDFEKGPFSTAWTNSLLDRATTQLNTLLELLNA